MITINVTESRGTATVEIAAPTDPEGAAAALRAFWGAYYRKPATQPDSQGQPTTKD